MSWCFFIFFFPGDYDKKAGKKEGKLGAKKKEKEDKKKDKLSYAALEGDSSPEEYSEMESLKSPFKGKKRSFKFSSRKDKKNKDEEKKTSSPKEVHRETEVVETASGSSKVADKKTESSDKKKEKKEKEKKEKKEVKETKVKEKESTSKGKEIKISKLKIKDKKSKSQPSLEGISNQIVLSFHVDFTWLYIFLPDDLPIFGVPLELAVQRGRCHDGVDLPAVVRCSIDFMEEHGRPSLWSKSLSKIHNNFFFKQDFNRKEFIEALGLKPEWWNSDEPTTIEKMSLLKMLILQL